MNETIINTYTLKGLKVVIKRIEEKNIYVMLILTDKGVCVGHYTREAESFNASRWNTVASAFIDGYTNAVKNINH